MKIIMVNDYKEQIGGTEVYMYSLKEELEKRGHTVIIFGTNIKRNEYSNTKNKYSLRNYFKKIFNFNSYIKFKKVVNEFDPDIIHIHNIFNELSPSILLATKSIPVVMTVHDNQIVNAVSILSARTGKQCKKRTCAGCVNCVGLKGAIYEKIKRKIHRLILNKIKLFIAPSQYMGDLIKKAGFQPVRIVPNGIKLFTFSKITNFNQLLYVGRLTKDKGVELLIRAMPEVIRKIPDIELTIVGDGPEKGYLKQLVNDFKIKSKVHFVGNINDDKIPYYYKISTVVVIPSVFDEPFGLVALEAMSAGRLIIASKVGGLTELINNFDNGSNLIIPSPSNLYIAITKLLSNKKKLEVNSMKSIILSKEYSISKSAEAIENIYYSHL